MSDLDKPSNNMINGSNDEIDLDDVVVKINTDMDEVDADDVDADEVEEMKMLWDSQVTQLKHALGLA